ncbi:MAG TPA: hypothetical protein VFA04_23975, partial [Bryobacteraceae bacterium]|nr:hypothetical protein [Bryobacteraceae bacterium]
YQKEQWDIIHNFAKDPQLDAAVYAVGVHYPRHDGKVNTPSFAKESPKPLWSSEDQPEFGPGDQISSREWSAGGRTLARIYNRNYIEGRMTKTEIWSPITSYYDNLAAPHSGLMYANTPWSGHYNVQPTIWITAHTTQFTEPGWRYIDSACGDLPGKGSYVTLRSPNNGDYTVVAETIDATTPEPLHFEIGNGFSNGAVHVWRSNGRTMFERQADIIPVDRNFTATLDPGAVYTFSTTSGQAKGTATSPPQRPFPMPYRDDFEATPIGGTPKYLSDQDGAFEAGACPSRSGRCLNQVVTIRPISWGISPNPFTFLGDAAQADYTERIDAFLPEDGEVALVGRIDSADFFQDGKALWPSGYVLDIGSSGAWQLLSTKFKSTTRTLASGSVPFPAKHWHHLELGFHGGDISASVDGRKIAAVSDSTHARGMAGFGSGWHRASFDNFALEQAH